MIKDTLGEEKQPRGVLLQLRDIFLISQSNSSFSPEFSLTTAENDPCRVFRSCVFEHSRCFVKLVE